MLIRLMIIVAFIVVAIAAFSQLNPSARQSIQPLDNGLSALRTWFNKTISSKPDPSEVKDSAGTTVYKWQDKDGQDRYTTEVVLRGFNSTLTMLDGRNDGDWLYHVFL